MRIVSAPPASLDCRETLVFSPENRTKTPQFCDSQLESGIFAASSLQVWIGHHFTDTILLIWIDDKLVYTHALRGEVKKRIVLFKGVQGCASEMVRVPAGEHRICVQSSDNCYDESAILKVTLPADGERTVHIETAKHKARS